MMLNNTNDETFSTEPLDEAMKELLEVCQQYNDKFTDRRQDTATGSSRNVSSLDPSMRLKDSNQATSMMGDLFNNKDIRNYNEATKCDRTRNGHLDESRTYEDSNKACNSNSDSIEKLRQRQCKLQSQLDEVLDISKSLEAKRKRKLSSIVNNQTASGGTFNQDGFNDDDEDSELIEFQQIENELRISELKRQMNNIQEELRLRLYRDLLTKTNNRTRTINERQPISNSNQTSNRRSSAQTDEFTPSSSSCSDDHTISSSISTSEATISSIYSSKVPHTGRTENINYYKTSNLEESNLKSMDQTDYKTTKTNEGQHRDTEPQVTIDMNTNNVSSLSKASHNLKIYRPITNEDCGLPSKIPISFNSHIALNSAQDNQALPRSSYIPNSSRNCAAINDLERIEEGEEEENDHYSNSIMLRKIYEEKLSPLLQASDKNRSHSSNGSHGVDSAKKEEAEEILTIHHVDRAETSQTPDSTKQKDYRFDMSNINSARRGTNRPLTLYMPKPDEDIDLIELIQAMGHDLDLIENDLTLSATTAHGYLYKSCSNNSKKWLKRFFYFDRKMKTLSYYETEDQLVKKSGAPKCVIPFDEIGDVYVDHRLSELSEKQKGFKKKSYVFILATIKRKYMLASPRAETMRAWIDILFTAAKANDYFYQLADQSWCLTSI